MDGFGSSNSRNYSDTSMSFWKKNSKTVPGRPSPNKEGGSWKSKPSSSASSFQDFQDSVRDAWDIGDDEFAAMSSEVKISKHVAQSTALSVINNHRTSTVMADNTTMDKESPKDANNLTDAARNDKSSSNNQSEEVLLDFVKAPPSTKIQSSSSNRQNAVKPKVISRTETESEKVKAEKIRNLLEGSNTDLKKLQSLSYSGLPVSIRGTAWKLLAGYLPANTERRKQVLERKREEYWNCVEQYYDSRKEDAHQDTFRQIHIDIPRMCPLIALFQQIVVQEMFERILFIWAIRHPASGYVQGMNDLVTPFFVVFLEEVLQPDVEVETFDVDSLPEEKKKNIEADSYWCMSKFLDSIQVNYIFAQTGIQEKVKKLKELIERIDAPLNKHIQRHDIDYLQFSFRWMNNLLMRELPLRCTIRLWDTYLAEPDGCGSILVYVCAAFLRHWREKLLKQNDFQNLMLLLQNLPTQHWDNSDISLIVAEAYTLKCTYDSAPRHWHCS